MPLPSPRKIWHNKWGTLTSVTAVIVAGTAITSGIISTGSDTLSPSLFLSAPSNGVTVSGTVTLSATCGDNVACVGVQFKVNGANVGAEDTSAPYSIQWVTGDVPGSYTLTAFARDAANNTKLSNSETIIVSPSQGAADVANVFVSTTGSDTTGSNCQRFSTPIAPPADASTYCATFNKAYHVANVGDVVEVACGSYTDASDPQGFSWEYLTRDATKEQAAQGTYVKFRPPPGQTAPGLGTNVSRNIGSGCVQANGIDSSRTVDAIGASHVEFDDMFFGAVQVGKSVSDAAVQGTNTDWKFSNIYTHQFNLSSPVRFKWIGGEVGNYTGCGGVCGGGAFVGLTTPGGIVTPGCQSTGCQENFIRCSTNCSVVGTDVLFDGVTFHDIYRSGGAHSACFFIEAVTKLTIRNSKIYNCDSQALFFQPNVAGGSPPNAVASQVLLENNWFGGSTDAGATSYVGHSIDIKGTTSTSSFTDWVVRHNTLSGSVTWSNDANTPITVSNMHFIGNVSDTMNCLSSPGLPGSPSTGATWEYNLSITANGTCTGTGNGSIVSLPVVSALNPNEAAQNYHLSGSPTACNFVPTSAYAAATTFTTAFSLYDPHAVLATDIDGAARPVSTGYDAGSDEAC